MLQFLHNPLTLVEALSIVGRVSYHHHDGFFALDAIGFLYFARQFIGEVGGNRVAVGLFERVGQIDVESLFARVLIACLCKQEVEFDMGDGIGCHHELKAIDPWKESTINIRLPHCGLVLELAVNNLHYLGQKCACACGRVENLYPVKLSLLPFESIRGVRVMCLCIHYFMLDSAAVGQSPREIKLALQNLVHTPHHETYYLFGCVVNPADVLLFGIIRMQKVLVETNHGVVPVGAVVVAFEQSFHISDAEQSHEIIDNPRKAVIYVGGCERLENLSQQWVGLGYEDACSETGEFLIVIVVLESCSRKSVGDCLGIEISKDSSVQSFVQYALKGFVEVH